MAISFSRIARTRRQVQRVLPILKVLIKHGYGHLVQQLPLQDLLPAALRVRLFSRSAERTREGIPAPRRLVMMLEELGPTFVKLGQMLSTRADVIPEPYLNALRTLTDRVPPFDTSTARKVIEEELGKPIDELFDDFAEQPLASGSIGQVYHAALKTGEQVVVKVKRPGVDETVMADLDLLETLARQAERIEDLQPIRPAMIVDEFRRSLKRELDFVTEATFTTKVKRDLAENDRIRIAAVYWDMTTSRVLTMERLPGVSLNEKERLAAMGVNREQIARDLVEAFLHQFFKTGLFHADPHAGNILISKEGQICLVDFGMAGRLDPELQDYLATSFIALAKLDMDVITDVYLEIGVLSEDTDTARLKSDVREVLDKYYGIPMHLLDFQRCFADAMHVARRHHVVLPRDLVLLSKSFVTMIMMARELDPNLDLSAIVRPYALSLVAHKLSPGRLGHSALVQLWRAAQMLRRMPREMRTLTRKLLSGTLQLTLNFRELDAFGRELDRATNRLAFSVLVAAIIIGSSLLLHAKIPPHIENLIPGALGEFVARHLGGVSVLGLAGFIFAGVLGMLLTIAIWRSGRL